MSDGDKMTPVVWLAFDDCYYCNGSGLVTHSGGSAYRVVCSCVEATHAGRRRRRKKEAEAPR